MTPFATFAVLYMTAVFLELSEKWTYPLFTLATLLLIALIPLGRHHAHHFPGLPGGHHLAFPPGAVSRHGQPRAPDGIARWPSQGSCRMRLPGRAGDRDCGFVIRVSRGTREASREPVLASGCPAMGSYFDFVGSAITWAVV